MTCSTDRVRTSRHPAAQFTLQESGSAFAVRISAPDIDLADLEARYVAD